MIIRYTTLLLFLAANLKGQEKKALYFLLQKNTYAKNLVVKTTTIRTKRLDSIYTFTIPCSCNKAGSLFFGRGINPETGRVNLPVRTINCKQLKQLDYVSFEELITIMKAHDDDFNRKFILYLVEPGKVSYLYHVFKNTSFGDDAADRVGP